jgi:hypothetical protein
MQEHRGIAKLARKRFARLIEHVGHEHLCAFFNEPPYDTFADSTRAAGDERNLAFESFHICDLHLFRRTLSKSLQKDYALY